MSSRRKTAIGAADLDQVQIVSDQAQDKAGEMALGHKILHPRGQKQRLIDLPGAECLAHAAGENLTRASLASKIRYYSDRLLALKIPLSSILGAGVASAVGEFEMIADPKRKLHQDSVNQDSGNSDKRRRQEEELDEALKNTFPASDPVSMEQP
jgi:hypothetical protein